MSERASEDEEEVEIDREGSLGEAFLALVVKFRIHLLHVALLLLARRLLASFSSLHFAWLGFAPRLPLLFSSLFLVFFFLNEATRASCLHLLFGSHVRNNSLVFVARTNGLRL